MVCKAIQVLLAKLDLHYQDLRPDWYGLGIHRASLHGVLWQAARELGIPIELRVEVESFSQDPQAVHLSLRDLRFKRRKPNC